MKKACLEIFETATIDFFYDRYFREEDLHEDWTDEEISLAVHSGDIETCLEKMRSTLYDHFGIEEKEK